MLKTDVETITKSLDENAEEVLLRIKLIMRYLCMLQKNWCLEQRRFYNLWEYSSQHASSCERCKYGFISKNFIYISLAFYASLLLKNFDNSDLSNKILVFAKNEVLSDVKKLFKPGIGVKAVYLKIKQQEDEEIEGKQLFEIVFRT